MEVCVGGTFNVLHRGHRALFDAAFASGDKVAVGLTTDAFARTRRPTVTPYETRRRRLAGLLSHYGLPYEIVPIERREGIADRERSYGAIVVSPETAPVARRINRVRRRRRLRPLEIIVVPPVLAENFLPISSQQVLAGEIDSEGRLLRPLRVHVGSTNPVKLAAVRRVLRRLFRRAVVRGLPVRPRVPAQPWGARTVRGAVQRAQAALEGADLGVGIEAGLLRQPQLRKTFDVQYCVVVDRRGVITAGHGSGFEYPPAILERLEQGETVGKAMGELVGDVRIGRRRGAIGHLSQGRLDRTALTEQAVLMAFLPRLQPALYGLSAEPVPKARRTHR